MLLRTKTLSSKSALSIVLFFMTIGLILPSCAWLPGVDGPRVEASKVDREEYRLVKINERFVMQNQKSFSLQGKTHGRFQQSSLSKNSKEYKIAPKDILSIIVWDHPELTIPEGEQRSSGYIVDSKGEFFFPYVGQVKAAGRTTQSIRLELTKRLKGSVVDPQVGVKVISYRGKEAYITGAVNKPGAYPLTDIPLTINQALAHAGGLLPNAYKRKIILNSNGTPLTIDLKAVQQGRGKYANYILKHGDILFIPENNKEKVFIMGEVNKPSTLQIGYEGLSLAEALSDSGSINQTTANTSGVFVVRNEKGSIKPTVYQLSLSSVHHWALAERFPLNSRDVVYVTASDPAKWSRLVNQILPFAALTKTSIDTKNSF